MLRKIYDWMMKMSVHPKATWVLAVVSFVESSFFPIPPDIMLIPMVIAKRTKAFFYAAVASISSVLGGAAGYAIGFFLFASIGQSLLDFYGYSEKFATFTTYYKDSGYGPWIVLMAGITPFPYKVITIASGVVGMNFFVFMIASAIARTLRFAAVAGLLYYFGQPIRAFIEKYFGLVSIVFFVLLIGGFVAIKFLF